MAKGKPDAVVVLGAELVAAGLTGFEPEVPFKGLFGSRRFRFDFADPVRRMALEVHGATFAGGGHTRGVGFRDDRVKMNEAWLAGWRVLEFTTEQVYDGTAMFYIRRACGIQRSALDFGCPPDLDIMEAVERRADVLRRKDRLDVATSYRVAIAEVLEHGHNGKRTRGRGRGGSGERVRKAGSDGEGCRGSGSGVA